MPLGISERNEILKLINNDSGDITAVNAGSGLRGGGVSGDVTLHVIIPGSDGQILYNNTSGSELGAISSMFYNDYSGDLQVIDDKKIYFGTDNDSFIEYCETDDNFLVISGSAKGMVLSGTTVQIRGVLEGASPLQIAGGIEVIPSSDGTETNMSFGDDIKLYFGDDKDSYIQYNDAANNYLEISGSSAGLVLSGSSVYIDRYLGIGVQPSNITHGITLPEDNTNAGKIKATAYTTYSSERYKENIKPIQDPLQIINNLEGVEFSWKKNHSSDIGFIAEQVGKYLPNVVEWHSNGIDAESMDYSKIVPILVEGIKSQQSQIDQLKYEISSLKALLQ